MKLSKKQLILRKLNRNERIAYLKNAVNLISNLQHSGFNPNELERKPENVKFRHGSKTHSLIRILFDIWFEIKFRE
jgi:hypothetical protein